VTNFHEQQSCCCWGTDSISPTAVIFDRKQKTQPTIFAKFVFNKTVSAAEYQRRALSYSAKDKRQTKFN